MEPEESRRLQPATLAEAQEELASGLLANEDYALVRAPADGGCWDSPLPWTPILSPLSKRQLLGALNQEGLSLALPQKQLCFQNHVGRESEAKQIFPKCCNPPRFRHEPKAVSESTVSGTELSCVPR